jgi:hypothetical protein
MDINMQHGYDMPHGRGQPTLTIPEPGNLTRKITLAWSMKWKYCTAWTWTWSMDMEHGHGHGHVAWTWTRRVDLIIQRKIEGNTKAGRLHLGIPD